MTSNVSIYTVETNPIIVSALKDFFAAQENFVKAKDKAETSAAALLVSCKTAGIPFIHWETPGKDATPEHVADHAVLMRAASVVLCDRVGCELDEFLAIVEDDKVDKDKLFALGRSPLYKPRNRRGWQMARRDMFRAAKKHYTDQLNEQIRGVVATLGDAKAHAERTAAANLAAEEEWETETARMAQAEKRLADTSARLAKDPANAKLKVAVDKAARDVETHKRQEPEKLAAFNFAKEADASAVAYVAELEREVEALKAKRFRQNKARARQTWAEQQVKAINSLLTALQEHKGEDGVELVDATEAAKKLIAALGGKVTA